MVTYAKTPGTFHLLPRRPRIAASHTADLLIPPRALSGTEGRANIPQWGLLRSVTSGEADALRWARGKRRSALSCEGLQDVSSAQPGPSSAISTQKYFSYQTIPFIPPLCACPSLHLCFLSPLFPHTAAFQNPANLHTCMNLCIAIAIAHSSLPLCESRGPFSSSAFICLGLGSLMS